MSRSDTLKKYSHLVSDCDLLIKAGKISEVGHRIMKLNLSQVPRSSRQSLAKICRRAGLINHGLRLLQPLIRNKKELETPATPGEISEYSVLLSRNGSVQEALHLLSEVKTETTPEALLYLGYCHISKWDYTKATPYLERFLDSNADDYTKLIARVNLASAYMVTSQWDEAFQLITETIELAEQSGAKRLIANCFELLGQLHFCHNNFQEARRSLDRANQVFGDGQSRDQFFVFKWQSIISATEKKSVDPLIQFRQEAFTKGHWESVRDADMYWVRIQFDQKLLDHVIFGTPMSAYRNRVLQEITGRPSENFILGSEEAAVLDLKTGRFDGTTKLNAGKKIHQTLGALTKDFYAPRNVGTLFAELYPDEYFDVNSSPVKIGQLLWRTRQWLQENEIPASIEQSHGTYRFLIHGAFGIRIPLTSPDLKSMSLDWQNLKSQFPFPHNFSAKEACDRLKWARSRLHRVAEWAIKAGELRRQGASKAISYQVIPPHPSQKDRFAA